MIISLKNHSFDKIQQAIATALSELCGEKVEVDVTAFEVIENIYKKWGVSLNICVSHKVESGEIEEGSF